MNTSVPLTPTTSITPTATPLAATVPRESRGQLLVALLALLLLLGLSRWLLTTGPSTVRATLSVAASAPATAAPGQVAPPF